MGLFLSIMAVAIFGLALRVIATVLFAGARTIGAAGKAVLGKGTFSENMELTFKGMQEFEIRFRDVCLEDSSNLFVKEIEGKGLFPVRTTKNIGFVISIFDETGFYETGEVAPVLSIFDAFQEDASIVYQNKVCIGRISLNQGFACWVKIGVIIPDMLYPPYSGKRCLTAIVRMVDFDNIPLIKHGFLVEGEERVIWQRTLHFEWTFEGKGYFGVSEHHDEAVALCLKIGMAVAMADGSLDKKEGEVLKKWVIKSIAPFSGERRESLKALYNKAMKESYAGVRSGSLHLAALTRRLNEIGDKSDKYEALELCFEIMAADGVAEENELKVIKNVVQALKLDMDEVKKMRDQKILNLSANVSEQASIENILGIEPDWSSEQIKKHLRVEFQKWNNRLNTLEEGEEREKAQLMLNRIAEARKKYAS